MIKYLATMGRKKKSFSTEKHLKENQARGRTSIFCVWLGGQQKDNNNNFSDTANLKSNRILRPQN